MEKSTTKLRMFENTSMRIDDLIEKTSTKLDNLIKLENDFKPAENVYSPVTDWGKTEAGKSVDLYKKNKELLNTERKMLKEIQKNFDDAKICVAIFGDVAVGKSQIINCILGRRLLQPANCHRKNCFIKINIREDRHLESITSPDGTVSEFSNDYDMKMNISKYTECIGDEGLQPEQMLTLSVTKRYGDTIVSDKVIIIDSPSGNNSQSVKKSIEKVVSEADVFIYVLNPVLFEKQILFLKQFLTKNSPPNIFVIVNKSDETDYTDAVETSRARASLFKEISGRLTDMDEAYRTMCDERIFFVSANETLNKKTWMSTSAPTDQQLKRLEEFQRFETIFEGYIDDQLVKKLDREINELDKIVDVARIDEECGPELKKMVEKRSECQKLISEKIIRLDFDQNTLYKDVVEKISATSSGRYGRLYDTYKEIIESKLATYKGTSGSGTQTERTIFPTIGFNIWYLFSASPFKNEEELKGEMKRLIEDGVRVIRDKLTEELQYYHIYIEDANKLIITKS